RLVLHRDLRAFHDPLAEAERPLSFPFASRNRVEAPMDEQAVLGLAKPLEALLASGIGREWFLGLGSGCRAAGQREGPEQGGKSTQFVDPPTVEHASLP